MERTGLPAFAQRLRRELFASRTDAQITLGQSYLDFVAGNPNLPETTVPPSE